jgi:hypothetical protein
VMSLEERSTILDRAPHVVLFGAKWVPVASAAATSFRMPERLARN